MATGKKRGRPPKKPAAGETDQGRDARFKRIEADYARGRAGQIYRDWQAWVWNTWHNPDPRGPHFNHEKAARGGATRMMASKYHLTPRQIQNIVSRGDALMNEIAEKGAARAPQLEKQYRGIRQMRAALTEALTLMRTPTYGDLLNGCPTLIDGRTPVAWASLTSDKARKDSLEYFTALLAEAFLRANRIATATAKRK